MKRSERLAPVDALLQESERECARRLANLSRRLAEAEQRCAELRRYLGEYQEAFGRRARGGIGVAGMRDYQQFMERLRDAVQQQDGVITQLRDEAEQVRSQWRQAAARSRAVGKVIAHAREDERRLDARRQQREMDEQAQRLMGAGSR